MNKVLVIIVSFNGMKWIERCLCSLALSSMKADAMVIDNASTDGTPDWIESNFPKEEVLLVRSKSNLGFGQANNIGFRHALEKGYEYVYLLNQDAWLMKDTLSCMMNAFDESDKAGEHYGILSPMQMQALRDFPEERFLNWYRISAPLSPSGIKETSFIMAAHWMIKAECVREVGGFSPAFLQYGEDDNYIHRAKYFGWKTGIVQDAKAVHDRSDGVWNKDKSMRLKCVAQKVKLSDPNAALAWRMVRQPLELLGIAARRQSSTPLKFLPSFLKAYPELVRLREESKNKAAFL